MNATMMSAARPHSEFVVTKKIDNVDTMGRRALLRFILSGHGTDGARSRAAYRLVADYGCRMPRFHRLLDRGWWAARPVDEGNAF